MTSGLPSNLLDFVAQNTNYHYDSWSLALSYDPEKGVTTGFLSADDHIDVDAIIEQLKASGSLVLHPMLLPAIMFRTLAESNVAHLNELHTRIVDIEKELRHVKARKMGNGLIEDQEMRDEELDYRSLSRRLNTCKKDQASRDGRHVFWRQFQERLLEAAENTGSQAADGGASQVVKGRKAHVLNADLELKQWVSFNTRIFEFLEGRDVNYGARIEAQLSLVHSPSTEL